MRVGVLTVLAGAMCFLAGCQSTSEVETTAVVPEVRPGVLAGYLARENLPDSLAFLPPPPAKGSAREAADLASNEEARALKGSPRWQVAINDVALSFPGAEAKFQCALETRIGEEETPTLYLLLRRSMMDAGLATYAAKTHYKRARPFMATETATCTPETETRLREDGSYPSGHSSLGWAWALILSEIDPAHADAIVARGYEFGQSRAVCNVHWQSDVDAGRLVGAAAVARLHLNPDFNRDLAIAARELAAVQQKNLSPAPDCALEDDAFGKSD